MQYAPPYRNSYPPSREKYPLKDILFTHQDELILFTRPARDEFYDHDEFTGRYLKHIISMNSNSFPPTPSYVCYPILFGVVLNKHQIFPMKNIDFFLYNLCDFVIHCFLCFDSHSIKILVHDSLNTQ